MSHLCFKRNFWDEGIVQINYLSTEHKRRRILKYLWSQKWHKSAQISFAVLHIYTWSVSMHMTFVIHIKLASAVLKSEICTCANEICELRWRAWFSFLDELFLWTNQLSTRSLLSSKRATSEHNFFPSGYVCVWRVNPARRQAKMWHPGLKEGIRAYRHDFRISNPFNTPCHISKTRLIAKPNPSLVFSRKPY